MIEGKKRLLATISFIALTFHLTHSQPHYRKVTIISYNYEKSPAKIDSSVYDLEIGAPTHTVDSWKHINALATPILYSEFIIDRKRQQISTDTTANRIVTKYYNDLTNEWFLQKKLKKICSRKVICWLTFYHEYHKIYFTAKIIMIFDKSGYLAKRTTYDKYLNQLESKEIFLYE